MTKKIAIASMSFCRDGDSVLQERILETMETLTKTGYPVFVADGGSPEALVKGMQQMGVNVITKEDLVRTYRKHPKLPGQHKSAYLAAAERADFVFYTEPDKKEWAKSGNLELSIEEF